MFLFLSQVLQHPLRLHVLTSRNVWSVMFQRRRGKTSLCSPTNHQHCVHLGSWFGFSPDVQVRSLLFGLEPWSRAWMCNLSWAVLSNHFNPVPEWLREKSCLYSWACSSQTRATWLRKSISVLVTVGSCESSSGLLTQAGFCFAFWVQAEPNPLVPHRSQVNTCCFVSSCRKTLPAVCLWVRRTTWNQTSFAWLPLARRASLGPCSSQTVMLTKVTPHCKAEVIKLQSWMNTFVNAHFSF